LVEAQIEPSLSWPSPKYCGDFTKNIVYDSLISGSSPADTAIASLMDARFGITVGTWFPDATLNTVVLSTKDWVGQHRLRVKTTVGSQAVGSKFYSTNTKNSLGTFTLTIKNPCTDMAVFDIQESPRAYVPDS